MPLGVHATLHVPADRLEDWFSPVSKKVLSAGIAFGANTDEKTIVALIVALCFHVSTSKLFASSKCNESVVGVPSPCVVSSKARALLPRRLPVKLTAPMQEVTNLHSQMI